MRPVSCALTPVIHGGYPADDRAGLLRRIARIADEGGFEHLFVEDHVRLPEEEIGASEGIPGRDEPLEAWTTLAFLAGITERVRLGTEVTPLTLRHPPLLAKTVATLDVLSGGRVTLGAGAGWHRREYEMQGLAFEKRGERWAKTREAIEVVQALWREERVTHRGRFYRLEDALVAPRPVQPGGPPIWFGGFSDTLLAAVARYGDAWIAGTNSAPGFVVERRAKLHELAAAEGRDPEGLRVVVPLMAHVAADRDRARASLDGYVERGDFGRWLGEFFGENARRYGLVGTPEDAWRRLQPYLDAGVRDFVFDLRPPGVAEESATLLAEHVLPRLAQA